MRNVLTSLARVCGGARFPRVPAFLAALALLAVFCGPAPALEWVSGAGEEKGYFVIASAADLWEFADRIKNGTPSNTNAYYDAVLSADIDIKWEENKMNWTAMNPPTVTNGYSGTFDGNGHKIVIKGVYPRNPDGDNFFGLFRRVSEGGVVRNLVLDVDFDMSESGGYAGGVTAILDGGTIENVKVYGAIGPLGMRSAGIACWMMGTNPKIFNCANYADITGSTDIGGIVAIVSIVEKTIDPLIEYCANYGEIICTGASTFILPAVGGIGGQFSYLSDVTVSIINCYNAGKISLPNISGGGPLGGLVGNGTGSPSLRVENCFNYGPVTFGGSDTPNGPVIMGGSDTSDPQDADLTPVFSNIFYLRGAGAALFGTRKAADPYTGGANGDDGWGSAAIKALVQGMTEDEFANITMSGLLNTGPGGTIDGRPRWGQGKEFPELLAFNPGLPTELTPPEMTPGAADRASGATAAVTFISDEDGWYYYAVVESGAAVPAIDTSGEGTALAAGETATITLTGLRPGAYDIHIAVKDGSGNVSEPLVMTIPAYTPSGVGNIPAEKPGIVAEKDIPSGITKILEEVSDEKNVETVTPEPITEAAVGEENSAVADRLTRTGILSADESTTPAAVFDGDSGDGVLVANTEALLEANTGEDAVEIEPEVIPLPILNAEVKEQGAVAVTTFSVPLAKFEDGFNSVGDVVMLKLRRDRSVTQLKRASSVSEITDGFYAITDGNGELIFDGDPIDANKTYLFVVGIADDGPLDWDTYDYSVVDPLYTALGSGGGGSSGSGGCSAGAAGVITLLLAAVIRAARRRGKP